jgi:hypothetical protein
VATKKYEAGNYIDKRLVALLFLVFSFSGVERKSGSQAH